MDVSYKKLWYLLIDRNRKKATCSPARLSPSTMSKLNPDKNIQTDVFV